jgi:hypothetical protein
MLSDEDKQWIAQLLEQVETRVGARLEQVETRFETRLEQVETRLLTEFHKWASPFEMRQRSHSSALRAIDAEIEALSDQIKKVDARLTRVEQR